MHIDSAWVRAQFPAFAEPSLQGQAFFENAGGSYTCRQVIERLHRFYTQRKVQPYAPYEASRLGGKEMDEARTRMAAILGVTPAELSFGPSTTQNTYVLAQAFGQMMQPGEAIVVTNQDHEANTGPWLASGGYGNLDAFVWYDTTTGANVGCYWFGGIPFAGFACGMQGTADDTQAYYSSAPGAADYVQMSSTAVAAGGSATWTVDNPAAGMNYSIIAAMSSAELSVLGGTCLVGYPNLIGGTPRVMAGGSFTTSVPALAGDVYTQAVEHSGSSASGATVTGFSNGLVHHF